MSWAGFHHTIRGSSHLREGIACQDSSAFVQAEGGRAYVFAVADGHGDPACSRSSYGSKVAVAMAIDILLSLAREVGTRLPSREDEVWMESLEALGPRLVNAWRVRVLRDFKSNPPSHGERERMEEDGRQVADARPEHLYGTTLVAGVLLPQAVVLLQQGDGCCVVVDEGGRFYAPIPEDERCVGNMTSSLCDEDAAARMRRGVYSRKRMVPLACFVGTDGVDKSLFGEEALFDFCAELMLLSCDGMAPEEEVSNRVRHHLEKLAEDGCGDDTSLACVVNRSDVARVVPVLKHRLARREVEVERSLLRSRIISMQRMHDRYLSLEPTDDAEAKRRSVFLAEYAAVEARLRALASDE